MADVRFERSDEIAVILLDRPEVRNALSLDMVEGIIEGLRWAEGNGAKGVVLAGAGGYFCAGLDLKAIAGQAGSEVSLADQVLPVGKAMARAFAASPLPSVSAVAGGALGGAFALAMIPDFCVAGRTAKFSTQYLKLGMTPDFGMSYFLTQRVGPARAAGLLLRAPVLDAPDAHAAGVVDEVVGDDDVIDAAVRLASEVGGRLPTAIQGVRALTQVALANSLDEHLEEEERWVRRCFAANPTFQKYAAAFSSRDADPKAWAATSGLR